MIFGKRGVGYPGLDDGMMDWAVYDGVLGSLHLVMNIPMTILDF